MRGAQLAEDTQTFVVCAEENQGSSRPDRDSAKHKSKRRTDRTRTVGPTLKKGGVSMTTTVSDKVKKIKAVLGFGGMSDTDLLKRLDAIRDGMTGNAAFPSPPVDMAMFKTAIDLFNTLVTDALDGGKKTISAKRKQREVVIKIATQLGHYVEAASNNELATFNTSGFVAVTNTRTPPQPLNAGSFKYVDRGPLT